MFLRMKNISDKSVDKIKTYFMLNNFISEHRAVQEIMWKNMTEPDRPHTQKRRMRFACSITSYKHTRRILNTYKWLRERVSVLRYTYNACLVC